MHKIKDYEIITTRWARALRCVIGCNEIKGIIYLYDDVYL